MNKISEPEMNAEVVEQKNQTVQNQIIEEQNERIVDAEWNNN